MSTGTGATIAATGQSPFVGRVRKISGWNRSLEALDDTGLTQSAGGSTPRYQEFIFADVITHAPITVELLPDGTDGKLPILGKRQTWNITFASGRQIAGSGAIVDSSTSELETNVRQVESFVLQFDGKTGPTETEAA